jgi:hypothetical protein
MPTLHRYAEAERPAQIKRWVLLYLTHHRYATITRIASGRYSPEEIREAIEGLIATGWIKDLHGQLEPTEPWGIII